MPPRDAQPKELDVAITLEWQENAPTLRVRQVLRKSAGLRSFVADNTPLVGDASDAAKFLAGGTKEVTTSRAHRRWMLVAALVSGRPFPSDQAAPGVGADDLAPGRAATLALGR